jgi:hypothetical protein
MRPRDAAHAGSGGLLVIVVLESMKMGLGAVESVKQKSEKLASQAVELSGQNALLSDKTRYLAQALEQQQKGAETVQVARATAADRSQVVKSVRILGRSFGESARPVSMALRLDGQTIATKQVEPALASEPPVTGEKTLTLAAGIPLDKLASLDLQTTGASKPASPERADAWFRVEGQLWDGRWVALNSTPAAIPQ